MVLKVVNLVLATAVCVLDLVVYGQSKSVGDKKSARLWLVCGILYFIIVVMRVVDLCLM